MSRFRNHISVLFLAVAVVGILVSMAHYHSSGLECLHHANEEHYTESDTFCPICTVLVYTDSGDSPSFIHILEYHETLVAVQELVLADQFHTPLLGRAPPALI